MERTVQFIPQAEQLMEDPEAPMPMPEGKTPLAHGLPPQTIWQAFETQVHRLGSAVALNARETASKERWECISWLDYHLQASRVGSGLQQLGVECQDTVLMAVPIQLKLYPLTMGIVAMGGIYAHIRENVRQDELSDMILTANATVLVLQSMERVIHYAPLLMQLQEQLKAVIVMDTISEATIREESPFALYDVQQILSLAVY